MNAFLIRKSPDKAVAWIKAPIASIDAGYDGLQRTMPTNSHVKNEGPRATLG
tara:strand:- start:435 stop:590 length:156 start_codon:yes stop_codon:yes gene_type:complete